LNVRRRLYWVGVLLAVALLGTGAVIGAVGYAKTAGPDTIVRGYFAAIARADAPAALSYGDVPNGPHTLLTATVLREQQRIAPLRHFEVRSTHRHGSRASVDVTYTLAFPALNVPVRVAVPLHQTGGDWRLDRVAIPTELEATTARERESIVGAGIPAGRTLLFPGALPIRFDTPYLQLDPAKDQVSFDALSITGVFVEASARGRAAVLAAVRRKLTACVSGPPDPACPLPDERYVPGSVHGSVVGELRVAAVELASLDASGTLQFKGDVSVRGTYRRLDFHNRAVAGHGAVGLHVNAVAYAVAPLTITWARA
jgi:hypothetical protein